MMATLVDSNIILDVVGNDPAWAGWSADALLAAGNAGLLVIDQIIYSETCVKFEDNQLFDAVLRGLDVACEAVPWHAAFLAGQAQRQYRARGGKRERTLPDFFIGAHAAVKGYRLLTRNGSRYRSYFPDVDLIAPDASA